MTAPKNGLGRGLALPLLCLAPAATPLASAQAHQADPKPQPRNTADGWISHPAATQAARPIVLRFRRAFALRSVPRAFPVRVTADNRFILYVNGKRVAAGPSTGDIGHWRYTALDLAPHLKRGTNVIAAVVWNGVKPPPPPLGPDATEAQKRSALGAELLGQTAPLFQQSVATGFRLEGDAGAGAISTRLGGWRVKRDAGHSMVNGFGKVAPNYYVASTPEVIDAATTEWDWAGPAESAAGWADAAPAPEAARRALIADRLPQQRYVAVPSGRVVRTDLPGGEAFPSRPVTIPANSRVRLLVQRDAMVSAYPMLTVSGGRGATVTLTYAEALYDAKGKKGDRDLIEDRKPRGIADTFKPDGERRSFAPLWWRTWRYAEIDVKTGAEPLVLDRFDTFETGYPFTAVASFRSSDPALDRIWDIGWRTAQIDAHETYMDSAYWEQLQYVGDTRLQMLISYAVSGDNRLAEQAIDAFGHSNGDGGLVQGAWPSRGDNVIATFSLAWIGMLHDWWMEQPDTATVARNLPRMREVLAWFDQWRAKSGLLTKNPQWNFVDWVGQSSQDRTVFPSYSATGESCLTSVLYLGALRQSAELEAALGDPARGTASAAAARTLADAIRARCWVQERGLFADNPDGAVFSQHMNALAVLYDVVPREQGRAILDRITVPGKGIDAPDGMYPTSYYFAWYLIRAHEHVGMTDRYPALLRTWRDLLDLHYTSWPEKRGETRSDTHAWSAHPTADLLGLVAGIRPAAPGYARVRIAPVLGQLTSLDAVAATPKGPVKVSYRTNGGRLVAVIDRPRGLVGTFEWRGKAYPLVRARSRFELAVE